MALLAREVGPLNGLGAAIMVAGRARAQQWLAQRSEVRGLLVDEQGRPRDIEVAKSSGFPRLDRAAVQAMRAARFQPHIEDGQPRMVWVPAPIHFQLDEL